MYDLTHGFVLSKVKYKDSDIIAKLYTKELGAVSYIVRGALKATKRNNNAAYFQVMSQLEFLSINKYKSTLYSLKDIRSYTQYKTIHTNVVKSSLVLFLSEVLSTVLKEEEPNANLYNYLEYAFQWLDTNTQISNFHILFLLNLTKYLGFYPDSANNNLPFFNLKEGLYQSKEADKHILTGTNLTVFKSLLGINFDALITVKINSILRQDLLHHVLDYYKLHLDGFKAPKSLAVFNQLFH